MMCLLSTAVDCGAPTNLANGQVSHTATTLGKTATYTCNPGYNLLGDSFRVCQATGVWSGITPICQRMLFLKAGHVYPSVCVNYFQYCRAMIHVYVINVVGAVVYALINVKV